MFLICPLFINFILDHFLLNKMTYFDMLLYKAKKFLGHCTRFILTASLSYN